MSSKTIHDLELHEELHFPSITILRVETGWIYSQKFNSPFNPKEVTITSTFVPDGRMASQITNEDVATISKKKEANEHFFGNHVSVEPELSDDD